MGKTKQTQQQSGQQQQSYVQNQDQAFQQQQLMQQLQAQQQSTQNLQNMINMFNQSSAEHGSTATGGTFNQTGTTTANLSPFQEPVVAKYFQDVMRQYQSGNLTPDVYRGERVAGLSNDEKKAQQLLRGYAGQATNFANDALAANQYLMDPTLMLDPRNIPGLQASKEANMQALTRNLTEQQLPYLRNQALLNGSYGGSKQGIGEGLAAARTNDAIYGTNAQMDMAAYAQGLQAMQNATAMSGNTMRMGAEPAQWLAASGALNRNLEQARLDADRAMIAEENAAVPTGLGLLQQLIGTQGMYGGTTTSQQGGASSQTGVSNTQGSQTGTQKSTTFAQQLANMLGMNLGETTGSGVSSGLQSGSSSGTSSGQATTTSKPSALQTLGAIASLVAMPFTFGASAAALPMFVG